MQSNSFFNWVAQIAIGLALIGVSVEVGIIFGRHSWTIWAACAVVCCMALGLIVFAEWREAPRRMLRKARRSVHFPPQWQVKFDKKIASGVVVPLAVKRTDGVRFVIDIRTDVSVSWGTPNDGSGTTPLVDGKGRPLKPDPVTILVDSARLASAAPVLWLPNATTPKNLRHPGTNLIVVMGAPHDLKHALQGAEIVPVRRQAADSRPSSPTDAAQQAPAVV
jgi:hypothetical protein